jgi:hypothetical protein
MVVNHGISTVYTIRLKIGLTTLKTSDFLITVVGGIKMYPSWQNSFIAFREYILTNLGERPDGYSIDRVDNNGSYEPGNLRWATPQQQAINQRKQINNTSGYRGVTWRKDRNKWRARICHGGREIASAYFHNQRRSCPCI